VTRISHSFSNVACQFNGVVQGSCIGPLLFLVLNVNDVSEAFHETAAVYVSYMLCWRLSSILRWEMLMTVRISWCSV